jgi:hypothetical protein
MFFERIDDLNIIESILLYVYPRTAQQLNLLKVTFRHYDNHEYYDFLNNPYEYIDEYLEMNKNPWKELLSSCSSIYKFRMHAKIIEELDTHISLLNAYIKELKESSPKDIKKHSNDIFTKVAEFRCFEISLLIKLSDAFARIKDLYAMTIQMQSSDHFWANIGTIKITSISIDKLRNYFMFIPFTNEHLQKEFNL